MVVGSVFGRMPVYNENDGKDHWHVTGMSAMGAGVRGNRVIGTTDDHVEALKINPRSPTADANGVTQAPQDIDLVSRQMAGNGVDSTRRVGIAENFIGIFS